MAGVCNGVVFVKTIQGRLTKGMGEIDFISVGKYRNAFYRKLSEKSTHKQRHTPALSYYIGSDQR